MKRFFAFCFSTLLAVPAIAQSESWTSAKVGYDEEGFLVYPVDAEHNRIPDFSYAGFRNGNESIPMVPEIMRIGPIAGDNTAHIQAAIDAAGLLPSGPDGFRGAVVLDPGSYEVHGTLRLRHSGVVLRGSGDEADPSSNTILEGIGNVPHQRSILIVGGGNANRWNTQLARTQRDIVTDFIPVGSRTFDVEDSSPYQVGDNIVIRQYSTEEWLEAIDFGGTGSGDPWAPSQHTIVFNRFITGIDGSTITIDAPVFDHLNRSLSQSHIYMPNRSGLVTNVGVESLRIDIHTAGGNDENHAWNAIDLIQVEDAWVRDATTLHFGLSGVRTNTATRVTVENVRALDPVAIVTGARMYNFQAHLASQLILFKDCHATNGRHHYVSNGASSASGVVFHNSTSQGAYAPSEGHRWWSQGLLFDRHVELDGPRPSVNPILLGLHNRGHYGTSHGWGTTHSVAWNCDVAEGNLIVQKPPTGQNYAIGCSGRVITGARPPAPFDQPSGWIEGPGRSGLQPESLYLAQLEDRHRREKATSVADVLPSGWTMRIVSVWPQPASERFTVRVESGDAGRIELRLYDITGRLVSEVANTFVQGGTADIDVAVGALASGIYLLRLNAGGHVETKRVAIVR
jgi:hypothetical protein